MNYIFFVLMFLFGSLSLTAESKSTTYQNLQKNSFEGEWILSNRFDENKKWFSIIITSDETEGHFKGTLNEKGTHNSKVGTTILLFHRVGDEYWGTFTTYSSPEACRVYLDKDGEIRILRSSGSAYIGKKISSFSGDDSLVYENTIQSQDSSNNLSFAEKQNTSAKDTSLGVGSIKSQYSTGGYGEISETTGRAKTVHVNGYYRKDGTYVKSHYRSPPRR